MNDDGRRFPIMPEFRGRHENTLRSIPWDSIAPHEAQAQKNHGQTLGCLARRGGLSAREAFAVMSGRCWSTCREMTISEAEAGLLKLVDAEMEDV